MPHGKPEILAPAGDMPSFLAALAAGADSVYVGLKHFSARMQAENFSMTDLSRMVELAEAHKCKVYVAFNTLIKPGDLPSAGRLLSRLSRDARPHGLIIQEPGIVELARQAGYTGGLYFSTLSNVSGASAMTSAKELGADRVILPRELSIDEVRAAAERCPDGPEIEIFVHGALCWCVSGRCYWSSYLGGKSSLRGRCVQPCRRLYQQKGRSGRFFSSLDLSLDVLVRSLKEIPQIAAWKIEGRKKGPHYVFHAVSAYRMLRDEGDDPRARKDAEDLLQMSLGRPTTRAGFLPQHSTSPASPDSQTNSGLLVGKMQVDAEGRPFFKPHQELLAQDYLRIGYEDERWHATLPVSRRTPKGGSLTLRLAKHKTPKAGTPVFLIDRRHPDLMALLTSWKAKLDACKGATPSAVDFSPRLPAPWRSGGKGNRRPDMLVRPFLPTGKDTRRSRNRVPALWMSPRTVREVSRTVAADMAWWLPPVIWQSEEDLWHRLVREAYRNGARHFVAGAPWQAALFKGYEVDLIAGPFCNAANALTLKAFASLGFCAAFAGPELDREDLLALPAQSPLPLGMVLSGWWPMAISRHEAVIRHDLPFSSPMKELAWTHKYGQNTWIYPAWPLDLTQYRAELEAAGYGFFAVLEEQTPKDLPEVKRPGLFNWETPLL